MRIIIYCSLFWGPLFLETPISVCPGQLQVAGADGCKALGDSSGAICRRGLQIPRALPRRLLSAFLWALVVGPFDFGGVRVLGSYFTYYMVSNLVCIGVQIRAHARSPQENIWTTQVPSTVGTWLKPLVLYGSAGILLHCDAEPGLSSSGSPSPQYHQMEAIRPFMELCWVVEEHQGSSAFQCK